MASEPDTAKVSVRLPNGERIIRRFRANDKIEVWSFGCRFFLLVNIETTFLSSVKALYDFVESKDLDPLELDAEVVIVNSYPRKTLDDRQQTIRDACLFPSGTVIVEES